jgi:hypothetical protein
MFWQKESSNSFSRGNCAAIDTESEEQRVSAFRALRKLRILELQHGAGLI